MTDTTSPLDALQALLAVIAARVTSTDPTDTTPPGARPRRRRRHVGAAELARRAEKRGCIRRTISWN